jgi:hypothetical protein
MLWIQLFLHEAVYWILPPWGLSQTIVDLLILNSPWKQLEFYVCPPNLSTVPHPSLLFPNLIFHSSCQNFSHRNVLFLLPATFCCGNSLISSNCGCCQDGKAPFFMNRIGLLGPSTNIHWVFGQMCFVILLIEHTHSVPSFFNCLKCLRKVNTGKIIIKINVTKDWVLKLWCYDSHFIALVSFYHHNRLLESESYYSLTVCLH